MGVFRFKKFEVRDDRSAMKVGTDGVLLGAATELSGNVESVLDIGTGCGLVSLMLAQRLSELNSDAAMPSKEGGVFNIHGIDIEQGAIADATENFAASPWHDKLHPVNMSLQSFAAVFPDVRFDLIVSNPPYYDNSLEAPDACRNLARHTGSKDDSDNMLSYREILEYSRLHLAESGRLWLVLPADQEKDLLRYSRMLGFGLCKILRIKSVHRKSPIRIIAGFCRTEVSPGGDGNCTWKNCASPEDELVLLDEKGRRTPEHAFLTRTFYL